MHTLAEVCFDCVLVFALQWAMCSVDYCVELLLFVLVLCKTRLPPTTETERRLIKSFNFKDSHQSLYA